MSSIFFFFNDTATTEIYTLSLHDALPIFAQARVHPRHDAEQRQEQEGHLDLGQGHHEPVLGLQEAQRRSEEHTSELQSPCNLVCRLLLEKKKKRRYSSAVQSSRVATATRT